MTPEQQAAFIYATSVAAMIHMQSMIAANQQRESEGKAQAYGEDEFLSLIDNYGIHQNATIEFFRQ